MVIHTVWLIHTHFPFKCSNHKNRFLIITNLKHPIIDINQISLYQLRHS